MSHPSPVVDTAAVRAGLKVLFIGGTGVISAAAAERAVALGHELTMLNRGNTVLRALPPGVELLHADVRDTDAVRAALGDRSFDVVANFVAFTPDQVAADIAQFTGQSADPRIHPVEEPVLAVLQRQDRLRGPAGEGLPR